MSLHSLSFFSHCVSTDSLYLFVDSYEQTLDNLLGSVFQISSNASTFSFSFSYEGWELYLGLKFFKRETEAQATPAPDVWGKGFKGLLICTIPILTHSSACSNSSLCQASAISCLVLRPLKVPIEQMCFAVSSPGLF